jgi:hypothetical protein
MDIDTSRARELLDRRDKLDAELVALFGGASAKKFLRCGHCHEEGHTARSCPKKGEGS